MTPNVLSLTALFCCSCLLASSFASPSSSGKFGSLTLCPAGGRSFAMAWSLACEMKRRKRSSGFGIAAATKTRKTAKVPYYNNRRCRFA
ncbi:hypothetical protein L596_007935 [Steinernema carpocapsae]|uniref:Secreted protein n=1 Tax=Steinernema carpocapsae TaxID=34508 RepID=A0A4U5PB43_STECR|nr:hypothetical protein L596_007935 [Steinernema carpocapsae]